MRELLITNDPVLLGFAQALLADHGVDTVIFDQHISVLEGSIGAFPRRLMIAGDDYSRACRALEEAGLAQWIVRHEQR